MKPLVISLLVITSSASIVFSQDAGIQTPSEITKATKSKAIDSLPASHADRIKWESHADRITWACPQVSS